jgi:hypothetical protein
MLAARAKAMSEKGGAAAAVSALTAKAKLAIGAWLCPSVQRSRQHSDESRYDSSRARLDVQLRFGRLVLLGLNEVSIDRLFAQSLARFEAMQPVCEDETITIAPNLDGCFLSDFQHTLRDLLDGLWFERCAALY